MKKAINDLCRKSLFLHVSAFCIAALFFVLSVNWVDLFTGHIFLRMALMAGLCVMSLYLAIIGNKVRLQAIYLEREFQSIKAELPDVE